MFGIGPWELLIVFAIVLLLFGGKRLPGIATGLGGAIKNFKEALKDSQSPESIEPKVLPKDSQSQISEKKSLDNVSN